MTSPSRRDLLRQVGAVAAALVLPAPLTARQRVTPQQDGRDPDRHRLRTWVAVLRSEDGSLRRASVGTTAAQAGELAVGTPYEPHTLETYLADGGSPRAEPLILSLTRFDCVTLVEACLAVARLAKSGEPADWGAFGREVARMRYRNGTRRGYASRLHYFSEWIADGERRGLVRDLGAELEGVEDARPLRFMTSHRGSYAALKHDAVFEEIAAIERRLDDRPRRIVPAARIPDVEHRIETGDVLAFATAIPGLDVSHAAFAYRDGEGVLRVLHAPLSGGMVEVTRTTLVEYVAAIRNATGILVARPA